MQIPVQVPAGGGERLWVVEDLTTILLDSAQTGGLFSLFEIEVSPGKGVPPHSHSREDETFILLEGQLTFWIDGKTTKAGPGDVLHAPKNVPHQFTNQTDADARLYVIATPGGFENFFRMIGDPADEPGGPAPAPDMDRMMAGFEAFGLTLLPPPE
ncbi:MAG: cupin domain-containing protein [Candidatus Hydrogenedens sp.]|nr:cupin domain-containing protein [Candidatus Hydrogenedens sp.]